eukprot:scaffold264402_cov22-Tisochrysis_lutea.AAC.1
MDMAGNKKGKLGHCALFTQEAAAQANDLRLVGSACKTLPGYCEASMLNELQLACCRLEPAMSPLSQTEPFASFQGANSPLRQA